MKLDFNYTGKTRLKAWWKQVRANFQTVQDEFNSHVEDFDTAVSSLTSKISTEAQLRSAADSALERSIAAEETERKEADLALQSNIDSEVSEREAADEALQTNIFSEQSARSDADTALETKLTDEISARETADNTLGAKFSALLQNNVDTLESADNALDARITAVEETAHTHDNKEVLDGILQTDIDRWNTNSSESIEEQLTEQTASLMREIALLYGMLGVTVYDGGLFTQEYDADTLDGGEFDTEPEDTFDCGTFEPLAATVSAGVDGGIY